MSNPFYCTSNWTLQGFFEGGIVGFLEKSAYLCVIAKINLFFG